MTLSFINESFHKIYQENDKKGSDYSTKQTQYLIIDFARVKILEILDNKNK
jgi:hypothetical protein